MKLSRIADGFDMDVHDDPVVTGVSEDSRRVAAGMVFVAIPGTVQDGHAYVLDAISRGAIAIVAQRGAVVPTGVPCVRVDSPRRALAVIAARFHGSPAMELDVIGFTGTFGKTSTSEILRALLEAGGFRPGVLGSLGARYGRFHDPGNGLTTPAPVELHRALRGLREAGANCAILEVTSHALRLDRVHGLSFAGGIIAAIMPGEHTDFHRTFDDYVAAKRLFLDYMRADALLAFDADNAIASTLAADAHVARRIGVSLEGRPAALQLHDIVIDHTGARFTLDTSVLHGAATRGDRRTPMRSSLLGRGHLRNVALALAYAIGAGVPSSIASAVLPTLVPLRRRMEPYSAGGRTVLDDTAAHPDSLRATFEVADLIRAGLRAAHERSRTIVSYAVRGNRGSEINRQNAAALAALATAHEVDTLIVTAATDETGAVDRATTAEIVATRNGLAACACPVHWEDTLHGAMRRAAAETSAGDLIVLAGAQGMNEGKRLLLAETDR